jgi:hypothetical protein
MSPKRRIEPGKRRLGELQDPQADAYLIDPGPVTSVQGETAARHALRVSTPEPIKRQEPK